MDTHEVETGTVARSEVDDDVDVAIRSEVVAQDSAGQREPPYVVAGQNADEA